VGRWVDVSIVCLNKWTIKLQREGLAF